MGLYESELNKQILLRKRQKREWDSMAKKMALAEEERQRKRREEEEKLEQERREEDRVELEETRVSKDVCSAMVKSALGRQADTLQKAVDVLQNQNGNFPTEPLQIIKINVQKNVKIKNIQRKIYDNYQYRF